MEHTAEVEWSANLNAEEAGKEEKKEKPENINRVKRHAMVYGEKQRTRCSHTLPASESAWDGRASQSEREVESERASDFVRVIGLIYYVNRSIN